LEVAPEGLFAGAALLEFAGAFPFETSDVGCVQLDEPRMAIAINATSSVAPRTTRNDGREFILFKVSMWFGFILCTARKFLILTGTKRNLFFSQYQIEAFG
jgi:hypothetical protein